MLVYLHVSLFGKFSESTNSLAKKKSENVNINNHVLVGNISSGVGTGSIGTLGDSSDHELLESSATGFSSNGLEDESNGEEDQLDVSYSASASAFSSSHANQMVANAASLSIQEMLDDNTTKRLKTFVATTLHNELIYLDKLSKLLGFKHFLEDNFNGSLADINVLFSGIPQIYTTHDIVASKLQEYFNSIKDLLALSSTRQPG